MLMQLCSIKVSLHLPAWHHPSLSLGAGTHTIIHNTFEHFFFFSFYVFTHDAHDCTVLNGCQSPFLFKKKVMISNDLLFLFNFYFIMQAALCVQTTYFHHQMLAQSASAVRPIHQSWLSRAPEIFSNWSVL